MTTITLPKALARRLEKASARVGRSPDAMAKTAIAERLDYLEGRLRVIEAGFEDLQHGAATTEEVEAELDRIIRKHERRRKKTA